jgi:hypothetical protein
MYSADHVDRAVNASSDRSQGGVDLVCPEPTDGIVLVLMSRNRHNTRTGTSRELHGHAADRAGRADN